MSATPSPVRVIGLPNGRRVTLATYARAWRKLRDLPPETRVEGWDHFSATARDILAAMSDGLTDRINRHRPGYGVGRKWGDDWFWAARRVANALNSRVRVYARDCPRELRPRLAHRFAEVDA